MTATAVITTEVDAAIMAEAASALRNEGLSLEDAIRLTIAKIARDKRLPFDAGQEFGEKSGAETPNELTRETMEKILSGEDLHKARDLSDLLRQLND